jgi:signal transduction histidine kinase
VGALAGTTRVEGTTAALRRPDGDVRWLRCSAAPVLSEGEADGVVLVAVDLTREREVEQLRSDFIATVSHELRTPLTPLSGFLGVMREHGGALDDDRRAMMVEAMEKQVGRLSDLIGDLLQVAEVERGLTNVHRQVIDLSEAVEDILDLEAVAAAERARVRVDLLPVTVVADRNAVRRILRALVSNGFKHTAGTVTVVTEREDGRGVVRVRDEGPGIPEASRRVIFEPFRRLGNHLHRTQGPGLGLSVARSLAEALDGTLDVVDPASGRGAEFVLRLPAAQGDRLRLRTQPVEDAV